jgi:hydrogenase maturation protease
MTPLLVGIGNPLRRDDAAGPAVVEGFSCRRLVVHQLLPEHAVELAGCDRVLFVDAAVDGELTITKLTANATVPSLGHTGHPAWLLAVCEHLYGRVPEAWLLPIPGHDFGFGDELSQPTRQAVIEAVEVVRRWLSTPAATTPQPEVIPAGGIPGCVD